MEKHDLITGRKHVRDIFAPDMFYSIPEYQRPYVWEQEQIEDLLSDVYTSMDQNDKKDYFIGCMIWNLKTEKDDEDNEYQSHDILDGQQRFITLFLLHAVLRDLSIEPELKEEVKKRLIQKAQVYSGIPSRNRVIFKIREDAPFINEFVLPVGGTQRIEELKAVSVDKEQPSSVRNMASGILVMNNWFGNLEQKLEDKFPMILGKYFLYLSTKVLALYLATPDNLDEAYNLFTVLNSRGMQLQSGDILRAQNLGQIPDKYRPKFAKRWSDFESKIDAPLTSLDDFLWIFIEIIMKYRSDENSSITKAFDFLYKRGSEKGGLDKGEDTINKIERYMNHFDAIITGNISNLKQGKLFSNLTKILTEVFGNNFLSSMMHYRERFGDYLIEELLIKMDNLLTYYWLIGRRVNATRIFPILRKIDEYHNTIDLATNKEEAARNFLNDPVLNYDYEDPNSNAKASPFSEFYENLDKEIWGTFSGSKINKTRYLLLKLDLLRANIHEPINFSKASISLEHLLPQKPTAPTWVVDAEEHQEWVHRLGNLVLIDRKKNSSMSNSDYKTKKEKYQKDFQARHHTNHVFCTYTEWSIDTIKKNHQKCLNILKQYYEINNSSAIATIKKTL